MEMSVHNRTFHWNKYEENGREYIGVNTKGQPFFFAGLDKQLGDSHVHKCLHLFTDIDGGTHNSVHVQAHIPFFSQTREWLSPNWHYISTRSHIIVLALLILWKCLN